MTETLQSFEQLLNIMSELRQKCPWDSKQTFDSLRTLTIEETYELADAIVNNDRPNIEKELGDLLLHIVFYAKMGSETGDFDIKSVIDKLCEKLIYRHPHIFADTKANSSEQVSKNWEELKLKEKGGNRTVLSGVPASLPALIKAYRVQDKARNVGFDWEEKEQVWDKVREEFDELQAEIQHLDHQKTEEEFGDLLFAVVNAGRLYGIDPENALEKTNLKFIRRFNYLEQKIKDNGLNLKELNLNEMNKIWNEAKESGL
ncbi:MAG: nucleoside triphosphate pyrophosphohydrolase [Prevotellaceae bacterium]|jgi:XTP/dITP diphosphohydrolase|nr:nucleoside triphosphate pyrophosphohydrolase [Prevotellaceae bacterium]